ncbi:hypothetical protein [Teichococcus vastitatis]|jgi:hypothetical protein|uniref:Uncharacterized protein n=1 Tax=Teichococcus vastitatis TaxID=2307076 RepID=A0ABS9W903_9PROT|nr:hypothetical protein [Pseudoroseomonas vastitatis]MCI0755782.1 hypothetical protein [Pseudoroseomonas vastitatis]
MRLPHAEVDGGFGRRGDACIRSSTALVARPPLKQKNWFIRGDIRSAVAPSDTSWSKLELLRIVKNAEGRSIRPDQPDTIHALERAADHMRIDALGHFEKPRG